MCLSVCVSVCLSACPFVIYTNPQFWADRRETWHEASLGHWAEQGQVGASAQGEQSAPAGCEPVLVLLYGSKQIESKASTARIGYRPKWTPTLHSGMSSEATKMKPRILLALISLMESPNEVGVMQTVLPSIVWVTQMGKQALT